MPFEIFQNSASTLPLCNFFLIHNLQSHFQYQECLLQLSKFSFLHKKAKYFWQYVTNWTFSCSYFIYNLYSYWAIWKYFDMFISEISFKTSQGVIHSQQILTVEMESIFFHIPDTSYLVCVKIFTQIIWRRITKIFKINWVQSNRFFSVFSIFKPPF